MTISEYLMKAVQDDARRAGERDRLLLEARRARRARRRRRVPAVPARHRTDMRKIVVSDFEEGLYVGGFNCRGITSRSAADGGAQERALGLRRRAWAAFVSDRWPRTGTLLRRGGDLRNRHSA